MKKYLVTIFLFLCAGALSAQKITATADSNQIKDKLVEFTRLYYKRTEVDSLVNFLAFPLYSKQWYGNKTWRSAKQFKQELKAVLMRSKFRQTRYTVQSIYQLKNKKNPAIRVNNYTCYQMIVHLPDIGEGENGSSVKFSFYVEKKKPYQIVGVTIEDL